MAQTASAGVAIPPIQKPGGLRGFHNAVRASEASIVPNLIRAGTSRTSRVLAAMSTGGISEAIRPIIGQEKIENDANSKARAMQAAIQTALPYDPDSIGGTLGELAGSAERMVPAVVYPPAAPLVLGTMGAETLGQSYLESDARGITDARADLNAIGKAGVEVGTEMVGLKFLGKAKNVGKAIANKAVGSTAANAAGVVAGGAAEESVAQIGQNIVGKATGVTPEVGITDGVPKAALGGALLSGGVVGTAYVGNRIANAWEQAPVIETAPEPAAPAEPTEFDRQEAAIDAKEPEWSKAPLASEFPATPAWQEAPVVDSAAKDAAIVQSENEQVADAQLRNLWQRRQQELMQREFDEYTKAEAATQAQQRQRDLEAADEEDIVAEVAGEAAKAEPTQYTEEELARADVRKIAADLGVVYDTDAMTIPRILSMQDTRRIAKLEDKELYWALKDRGIRQVPAGRGDRINMLLNFIQQNRQPVPQEKANANSGNQAIVAGARPSGGESVPPADVRGELRNAENLPAQQPGVDLPKPIGEISGPNRTAADESPPVADITEPEVVREGVRLPRVGLIPLDPNDAPHVQHSKLAKQGRLAPEVARIYIKEWQDTFNPDPPEVAETVPPPTATESPSAAGGLGPADTTLSAGYGRTSAGDQPAARRHTPRSAQKKFSRAWLENAILEEAGDVAGPIDVRDDPEIREELDSGSVFHWPDKDNLPGEIRQFLRDNPSLAKKFTYGRSANARGPDAFSRLGDLKYFQMAEIMLGDQSRQRLEQATKNADRLSPRAQFLVAIRENLQPTRERVGDKWRSTGKAPVEPIDPANLPTGSTFEFQNEKFEIIEDADGLRLLKDGDDYPVVPADAVGEIPSDRGTLDIPASENSEADLPARDMDEDFAPPSDVQRSAPASKPEFDPKNPYKTETIAQVFARQIREASTERLREFLSQHPGHGYSRDIEAELARRGSAPTSQDGTAPKRTRASGRVVDETTTYDAPEVATKPEDTPQLSTGTRAAGGGTGLFGQPTFESPVGGQEEFGFKQDANAVKAAEQKAQARADAAAAPPESEQIGSKSARDPKNTGNLFGGGGTMADRAFSASGLHSIPRVSERTDVRRNDEAVTLQPIPMPELFRLAKELMNLPPSATTRLRQALGTFRPAGGGEIRINTKLGEDPVAAAATLAHEIGHLWDYLPDRSMDRGNILGRIATLKNYLKTTIDREPTNPSRALTRDDRARMRKQARDDVRARLGPEATGAQVDAAVPERYAELVQQEVRDRNLVARDAIHEELLALTRWWKPYNPDDPAQASYIAYRESSVELYADAMSVLMNSPGSLERIAPTFFKTFLGYMERKAEVRRMYYGLIDTLNGTPEEVAELRRNDVREMFGKAEEVFRARTEEHQQSRQSIISYLKQLLFDISQPIMAKERQVKKGELPWSAALAAKHALEEFNLKDNAFRLYAEDVTRKVKPLLDEAGVDHRAFGEYLMMNRIGQGDRGGAAQAAQNQIMALTGITTWPEAKAEFEKQVAATGADVELLDLASSGVLNPLGYNPDTAREYVSAIKKSLGPERFAKLEQASKAFTALNWKNVQRAVKEGVYSAETVDELEKNKDFYVTFAVTKYLDTRIKSGLFKQVGTFNEIANPFEATLMKNQTLLSLIEANKAKRTVVDALQLYHPGDIQSAGVIDKYHRLKAAPQGKENIIVLENGKAHVYVVDEYIARIFNRHDIGSLSRLSRWIASKTYGLFHPLWIGLNPAWQMLNVPRDMARTFTNAAALHADAGFVNQLRGIFGDAAKVTRGYFSPENWKAAMNRARGKFDPLIRKMMESRALGTTFTRARDQDLVEADQFDRIMKDAGIWEKPESRWKIIRALEKLFDGMETWGTFLETLPKVAMWKIASRAGFEGQERAYVVRNYSGTPNTQRRGGAADLLNGVFPYSNVMLQGYRADAEIAFNPRTASGRWMRSLLLNYFPKAAMAAAAAGLFGDELAELMAAISEYEKSKYIILPVGWSTDDKGEKKAVYFRLPHNDTDRLLGAAMWKVFSQEPADSIGEVIGVTAGEMPGVNPFISMGSKWTEYASGKNPTDDFRGRDILTRDEDLVRGWPALKKMMLWTSDQTGIAGQLLRTTATYSGQSLDTGGKSTTFEKISSVPGLNALLRVTNRGDREQQNQAIKAEDRDRAAARMELPENARRASSTLSRLNRLGDEHLTDREKEKKDALREWNRSVYLPALKSIKDEPDRAEEIRSQLEMQTTNRVGKWIR